MLTCTNSQLVQLSWHAGTQLVKVHGHEVQAGSLPQVMQP